MRSERIGFAIVDGKSPSHPISIAVAAEASRYLVVIDHVLAMGYLKPDLRRRVVKMQQQLMDAESTAHYHLDDAADASP